MKRACGFVIFRQTKPVEYLLMQASYGDKHWTPPKGHVDPGESDMETALRETKEEAGLEKSDLQIYEDAKYEIKYSVKGQPKTVVYWLAELTNKNKSISMSSEHIAYKWLPIKEACDLSRYEEMQDTLKFFDRYINEKLLK